MLCERIGERRAGSPGERAACDYIASRFRQAGIESVTQEAFPCISMTQDKVSVQVREGRRWNAVESCCLVGAPATDGTVRGELVWLEMPESAQRLKAGCLRGKIAMLFGPLPTSVDHHRRLLASSPGAIVHVDDRIPFPWVKNDGVYPLWVQRYGMPPTVTIPYMEAWRWRKDGLTEAKIKVQVCLEQSTSSNIIAEIPGTNPQRPAILLTAHHDTQAGNTGADDNASGVVALLEMARVFAQARLGRPLRFISFGTEEQLSLGAANYVRRHRKSLSSIGIVLNFDSISSPLGHNRVYATGTAELARTVERHLRSHNVDPVMESGVMPYSDHFPFSVSGIPTFLFYRNNCGKDGRWQHHSIHDSLDNVSLHEVVRLIEAVIPLVNKLCRMPDTKIARGHISREHKVLTQKYARELFNL